MVDAVEDFGDDGAERFFAERDAARILGERGIVAVTRDRPDQIVERICQPFGIKRGLNKIGPVRKMQTMFLRCRADRQ